MKSGLLRVALEQQILPAVTFNEADDALPVAEAMLKGGLHVMEITFRTGLASASIRQIRKQYPDMNLGAGTLLNIEQVKEAIDAGAQFGLAPGLNPAVCQYALKNNFPFIPGVMTPSEIGIASSMGLNILKLFPVSQIGGTAFLNALRGPYGHLNLQFIPMGGVSLSNMRTYLQLNNVIAVGGSWIASEELIRTKQFEKITDNSIAALNKEP